MKKNQDKGFTLVELLIVIVILGILATVTVFAVRGITDQGETNACATDARILESAVESWYAQESTTRTDTDATAPAVAGDGVPGMADLESDALLTDASTRFSVDPAGSPYQLTIVDAACGTVGNAY